ncbi:MAG: UDP-N-acetylmuramoyl-tripeptide--D-alanyl-D-alanine ligase [Eubacteriales bacterium]
MKPIKIKDLVKSINGELLQGNKENIISGVKIDSRKVCEDDLFVPIKGEFLDGHDFIQQSIIQGCSAVLISNMEFYHKYKSIGSEAAFIFVQDPIKAIQDFSAFYINLFNIKKIAITGSTGKTTTKEMLHAILSEKFKAVKNYGNYNNELGLPLTIFNLEDMHEVGIFEMGMSGPGEIDLMAKILKPDICIITNIGLSHIEHLGTKDNILKAKMEVVNYFNSSNVLILNGDDELLREVAREDTENAFRIITVGLTSGCDVRISEVDSSKENLVSFDLKIQDENKNFEVSAPGAHNAYNCALALTCATVLGVDLDSVKGALKSFATAGNRLKIKTGQGIKIIDDTYNASPDSMEAAIDVLAGYKSGRRVAILGDMLELGEKAEDFHKDVLEYCRKSGIELIISYGQNFEANVKNKKVNGTKIKEISFSSKSDLEKYLAVEIAKDDIILVKGSRGMEMETVVEFLCAKAFE